MSTRSNSSSIPSLTSSDYTTDSSSPSAYPSTSTASNGYKLTRTATYTPSSTNNNSNNNPAVVKRSLSLNSHQANLPFFASHSTPTTPTHHPATVIEERSTTTSSSGGNVTFPSGRGREGGGGTALLSRPLTQGQQQKRQNFHGDSTTLSSSRSSPDGRTGSGSASRMDPAASNQLEAKVVILGSQGVGKTSIIHRYTSGHFSYALSSTIGASFLTKKLVVDGVKVRIQLWDTAGQERFRSMAPLYYRGALAAILVYDITNADSFNEVKIWLEELRRNMAPDLIIHVVGSKADLAQTRRAVDLEQAREAIADWVYDDDPLASTASTDSPTPSRSPSPSTTHPLPQDRPRSRTLSTQRLPTLISSVPSPRRTLPIITAPPTTSPPSFVVNHHPATTTRRTRLSSQVTATTTTMNAPSLPTSTSTSSFLFSDHLPSTTSTEMTRSGSNFSLSLGGLGLGVGGGSGLGSGAHGHGRRGTDEGRKSFEEVGKIREERERVKKAQRIRECGVQVNEVSAKDDIGIEELFLDITQRLVERKAEIESARVLRSRDSIMLTETTSPSTTTTTWCC